MPTSWWRPTRARPPSRTSPTPSAAEYGFWLGDAFASGGSAGYDHKKMGITARGALGMRETPLPRDRHRHAEAVDFTVAGIGDMSGDVFGNGVLLSRHIRLQAAFNHRHIFIDPEPGHGGEFRRTRTAVRPAALELGRLRPQEDLARRRHVLAQRQVHRAVSRGAQRCSDSRAPAPHPTTSSAPSCACRWTCCGTAASAPT